jgi:hypothetical protein
MLYGRGQKTKQYSDRGADKEQRIEAYETDPGEGREAHRAGAQLLLVGEGHDEAAEHIEEVDGKAGEGQRPADVLLHKVEPKYREGSKATQAIKDGELVFS